VDPIERVDPLTGERSVIVGRRQARPNLPADDCPFCPGGLEAPEPYDVRWFPNRWPPLPAGRAEVVLYAPEHDASLATLAPERVERLVALWADRTTALGASDEVAYVLVFENRGPEVGATIAHPHGQIYAFDAVPPAAARELVDGPCALCDEEPGSRLVATTEGWRAWVPDAATWPYGLVLAPSDHVGDLAEAAPTRAGLAALLVDVFARLDRLFHAPMPAMWWWHQRPTDGGAWPGAHLHAHVAPLLRSPGTPRFVAAGELGSGVFFNPVAP
jgi:UDPglucose--hexose-1-phosphate uridylyltransferase